MVDIDIDGVKRGRIFCVQYICEIHPKTTINLPDNHVVCIFCCPVMRGEIPGF